MDQTKIIDGLKQHDKVAVEKYTSYLNQLLTAKDKRTKQLKNPWMKHKKEDYFIQVFNEVAKDGLLIDGEDITLQSTGVSYSYQAYKRMMLQAYPDAIIDTGIVHKADSFNFSKNSGKIKYDHNIADPFNQSEQTVIGAYCVIKNVRGEFLTLLSKADIDKHRKVAKTDYIWEKWYLEMVLKTIMKKGCKQHFKDVYYNIERIDNENYDLEKVNAPTTISSDQVDKIVDLIAEFKEFDDKAFLDWVGCESLESIPAESYNLVLSTLKAKKGKENDN